MNEITVTNITQIITIVGVVSGVVYALYRIFVDYKDFKNENIRKAEERASLSSIIARLSSNENSTKISAAIMLRRFLNTEISKAFPYLQTEAINTIASLLKILPTGVFQKTLADSLAYAVDLSDVDLQRTNLQDSYIGRKDTNSIKMNDTDLYLSDLSYALIENVEGNAIFYRAILLCTRIKNCKFENASFREADLTNVTFKNVVLKNADFTNAINIPDEIKENLVMKDGKLVFDGEQAVFAEGNKSNKTIFFSIPSVMSKDNELLTKDYKSHLEERGYKVLFYTRDDYPEFGQLNKIRERIMISNAMIVFGFKQTQIHTATYRPHTSIEQLWKEKWISTPWNEIEVGMGLMKGLPILLVKDASIDMGIFDEKLSECFVATITIDEDCRKIAQNPNFVEWLSKV